MDTSLFTDKIIDMHNRSTKDLQHINYEKLQALGGSVDAVCGEVGGADFVDNQGCCG